jgi:hypothetical protein
MKSILFVRGFATPLSSGMDDYLYIKLFLSDSYDFVYFDYDSSEDPDALYLRMCSVIESRKFDILMGHSLGGGLLAKYCKENPLNIPKYEKIILLMPFLCKNIAFDLLTLLSFVQHLLFPKGLFAPSSYIFEGGNIMNNDYSLISFKQPFVLYSSSVSNDVSFIINNPNITVFYALDEKLNIIDEAVLQQIPISQLKRVQGLHECWRSIRINNDPNTDFFAQLRRVLNSNCV